MYNENIDTVWHRKLCIKSWSYSKNFVNVVDFSCMNFWAKTVPILPNQSLLIPLNQNMSIVFVSNMYNGNVGTFWHIRLGMKTWYSSDLVLGPN